MEAVTEGSDVTLICYIQANPPITDVTWRFNGKTLFSSPSRGIVIKNSTVILAPARKEYQGYYQCQAYNTEGVGTSEDVFLRVYYSPKCMSVRRPIYRLTPTETLSVACEVDADPTDVTFKWVLNKTSDNGQLQQINTFKSNGTRSVLRILPETEFGYGVLLCMASNRAGKQQHPCEFNILPAGTSEPPKYCLIANRTSECIVVQCEAGSDGGLTQSFQMEMFNTASDFLQANISVSETPAFTVCSLPIQSSYILVIYSINAKGRSKPVALQSSTLRLQNSAEEDELQINHLRLVGVLVGSVSVVILITFASITLAKIRARKRRNGRNFNGEMEKSQTHLMKECKDNRRTGNQGPDIIPEKNYIQERSDPTTRETTIEEETNPKRTKGEPPPSTYDKYQTIQYGEDTKVVLSAPGKLRMIQEAEGEVEECSITVETPLINDVQLNIRHWGDAYKEVGVLSTPV